MPRVKCNVCNKEFYAKPNWLKRGFGKYCSRACHYKAAKTGEFVKCFICKKVVYKRKKALKHSKSGKYFCGKSCQTIWRNQEFIGPRHGNWKGGEHINYREIMKKSKIKPICSICNTRDKRILCVHHLDKNKKNNKINNLTYLCRNCHHLVHNYAVKI